MKRTLTRFFVNICKIIYNHEKNVCFFKKYILSVETEAESETNTEDEESKNIEIQDHDM